tara:strand:+ start:464 stop:1066 length:603 start_codon:yes stop_codon:yes gene_type:complete
MAEVKTKKVWYKRWWAITLFIIIGLAILGNLFGGNDTSPTPSNSNVQTNSQQQITTKTEEVKTYSIGDSIQAGDFTWKITKSSTATEIGEDLAGTFFGEKADGVFIILDVEVENTGNSAKYLMDSYLKLVDEQGREFSPNSAAAIYLKPQGSALMFEQVNPGIIKKGKIVFDVPTGLKVANIRISSNLVSSSFYNVKLMI